MKPAEHLTFVDGLRACAIVPVVLFHTRMHSEALRSTPAWWPTALGLHGVDLFFVISGFCLSYPTLRKLADGAPYDLSYRAFIARRLVRIFPPFWIAVAALCVFALTPAWQTFAYDGTTALSTTFIWQDALRELALLDGGTNHNGSFWSLAVELRWYFVFPLALWLFVKSPRLLWTLALGCWVLYFLSEFKSVDVGTLPAFLLGIVAADAFIRRPAWLRFAPYALLLLLTIDLAIPSMALHRWPVWELTCFAFVLTAFQLEPLRRALSWAPLVAIGIASYSIYLIHEPVLAALDHTPLVGVPAALVGIAAGFGFWALVERPLQLPAVRTRLARGVETMIDFGLHASPRAPAPRAAAVGQAVTL